MNCKGCRKSALLDLDNRPSPHEERQMQKHLERCPACQKQTEQMRKLCAQLQEGEFYPSEGVLREIRLKAEERLLQQEPRAFSFIPILPRFAYGLAVFAAIFIFISIFLVPRERLQIAQIPEEAAPDLKKTEEYFKGLYVTKVRRDVEGAFSVIDRTVSLAKITSSRYYFSFSPRISNTESALSDLEGRVKEMI